MKPVIIGDNLLNFSEDQSAPLRVTEGCYSATVSGVAVPPDKGDDWDGALIFRFRITAGPVGYAVPEGVGQTTGLYCGLGENSVFKFGQTLAAIGFGPDALAKIVGTQLAYYEQLKRYAAFIYEKTKNLPVGLEIIDSTYRPGQSEVYQVIKYAAYEERAKLVPATAPAPAPAAAPAATPSSPTTPSAPPVQNGQADLAATVAASLDSFAL